MRSDDLAPLLLKQKRDIGMRQGVLLSWDPATGNNTVQLGDVILEDLPVLASGSVAMAPGDVVALQRYRSSYFIEGAIRNAGTGSLQTRAASNGGVVATSSTSYVSLSGGPVLSDVYIGPSRQCEVKICSALGVPAGDQGFVNFEVSGASTIAPQLLNAATAGITPTADGINITVTAIAFLGPDDGLQEGLNTFTMKYRTAFGVTNSEGGTQFQNRRIIVTPY